MFSFKWINWILSCIQNNMNWKIHTKTCALLHMHARTCTHTCTRTRMPSSIYKKNSHKCWLNTDCNILHPHLTIQWVNHNFFKFRKSVLQRPNDKFVTNEKNDSSAGCDRLTAALYVHTSYQHYVLFSISMISRGVYEVGNVDTFFFHYHKTVSINLWPERNKSQRFLCASIIT